MAAGKKLLARVKDALISPSPPSPEQRIQLLHSLRAALPSLRSLLAYPPPKASDRSQVQSKIVSLPDSPPIPLDDTDVHLALKLSDDLNLNEIECVRLLVSANREWILCGRETLEIYRLAAGLWYSERRDLITSLYILLRSVLIDQGLDPDIIDIINNHLTDIFNSGLRQRLISLIKELKWEEPTGVGRADSEPFVLDFGGTLVERRAVVFRERLILSHCLALSVLIGKMSPKDIKDIFVVLKECAGEISEGTIIEHQIAVGVLFSLVITLISDALSSLSDRTLALSSSHSFVHEFHELVMTPNSNIDMNGFIGVVRLAWVVYLMLTSDQVTSKQSISNASSREMEIICSCLETVCSDNVFQFLLKRIIKTAAYQNDDDDVLFLYNGYMHKLMMCFLSHSFSRDKIKELKDKAIYGDPRDGTTETSGVHFGGKDQPFISLLQLIGTIYQKEPKLLVGNNELWTFVTYAGEDHTNIETLVAFLSLLSSLASNEEGASKVFELLQGKVFRSVCWSTLFECLSIYEEKFKQALQMPSAMLPDFSEVDARALVAYLDVLQKVVENGSALEVKNWFPDIEPLFKLLSYESVPPHLKGALRNTITAFVKALPILKNAVWGYLEQYDLPVVVGPPVVIGGQHIGTQVYDMRFELNEIEARSEHYPSTTSFLNLLNALIAEERDVSDRGRRFLGIFSFVYGHVFGPYPQRAYADPCEKWQLVLACLEHFRMILSMYGVQEQDSNDVNDLSQPIGLPHQASSESQLPVIELLKDFMSGKIAFRNIMNIISCGVNTLTSERTSQIYGPLLERVVHLSLEIVVLVMEKDLVVADFWRPFYQPLDVILSQDQRQIVALLEYVRYDFLPQIQKCSIRIMNILSSRIVGLVQLLVKAGAANSLIEDYAACLELRFEEHNILQDTKDDVGVLILQLLIDNIDRPAPNITQLLLKFDIDNPVDRSVLQPKYHYSCLKIILDNLEDLPKSNSNFLLHEFSFQLLYILCVDPLTSGPTMDLLSSKKYQFFSKHVESISVAFLPKRSSNQPFRISTLHQWAWLLKLLALELHSADLSASTHRETCVAILSHAFGRSATITGDDSNVVQAVHADLSGASNKSFGRYKVLEFLDVVLFRSPDIAMAYSQYLPNDTFSSKVEEVLGNSATSDSGGVYYYSERGDRLIDLDALHAKLLQISGNVGVHVNESQKVELRESFHNLLRWGWRYNKNLEEQAAQHHMLTGWSHIVEIAISRRMSLLDDRSLLLFDVIDASLTSTSSPDCSTKMALTLTNVALTCMAKLREERFLCSLYSDSDSIMCFDIISSKQLTNGSCHTLLFKLIVSILRSESSESLRRRQYALLLSFFQYCNYLCNPDVPQSVLRFLLDDLEEDDAFSLQKLIKEQNELTRSNFNIIKKEAQSILNLIVKDAMQGSEAAKTISFYVLDALIGIDHEKFFLNQLQSRRILGSCLTEISNFSPKDLQSTSVSLQRLCSIEAQLSMLLRVSFYYGKHGSQILLSMDAMERLTSCKLFSLQHKGTSRSIGPNISVDRLGAANKQRMLVNPVLRLMSCLSSLVDSSEYLEVNNKIVRETISFVNKHQSSVYHILKEDISEVDEFSVERVTLAVHILSKVWPYEESDNYGIVQELFSLMRHLFNLEIESLFFEQSIDFPENQKGLEIIMFRLYFSLCAYIYFLLRKRNMMLQAMDVPSELSGRQITLQTLSTLLNRVTALLERAGGEKFVFLNKIRDINELSRQEVDEILEVCRSQDRISPHDNIRMRRYLAMIEMCSMVGRRDQLITLLIQVAECIVNIFLVHFGANKTDTEDFAGLSGILHPILERLEQLKEDNVGHSLKLLQRSVSTLKEMSVRSMSL